MVKVVGYARVSSKSQADNTSLAEQERQVREYCSAMGYELTGFFKDVRSGKTNQRDGLEDALAMVADCDGLIAAKLDRVGRNAVNLLTLDERLRNAGKRLILTTLNIDTSTAMGRAMFGMVSVMAQLDCETVNERFQSGRDAVRREGGNIGGAPAFGKKASDKKRAAYIDNPDEQKTIDLIRRHRRSGKSFNSIAQYLNKQGIPTKRGKVGGWTHVHVKRILDRLAS
jgi:DNA invertase Pin-like site-specific DNA recombinase